MNKKINIRNILIILLIILLCSNILLIILNLNNINLNIEKQAINKEQLTSITEYIDMATHFSETKNVYEEGYNTGLESGSVDAFNYHFKVVIPCAYGFSGVYHDEPWTKSGTTSFYIEYDGGTVKTTTLNSPSITKWSDDVYTGLEITNAYLDIVEKDKFTATFSVKQTFTSSWEGSKTATATVQYDHGTITYTFPTTNWDSGSYDMTMKKNGDATVTIY